MTTSANDHTVLITGGSRGIGLELARRFVARGDRVTVTGRRARTLARAAREVPGLGTFVSDVADPADRVRLAAHVREAMPGLDLVVNNAGVQRRVGLASEGAAWAERQAEIDTLLAGPVHLNHLLVPVLLAHGRPATVVNVTSGGAFVPQPFAPLYSACKAALHSYTANLRLALRDTPVRVVELIPPAVATGLAGSGATHGVPLGEFADAAFAALGSGMDEIGYGATDTVPFRDRLARERELFDSLSTRFPVAVYEAS